LKNYETNKLFYGTYIYKLTINNGLSVIFRYKNLSYSREVLDKLQHQYEHGQPLLYSRFYRQSPVKEHSFLDARKLYIFFCKTDDYTLRIEGSVLSIYSNSKEWIYGIKNSLNAANLLEFWEPNPDHITHLVPNTIIVPSSNGYGYKVTFGSGMGNTSGFANWAKNNLKQVKVGPVLMNNLERNNYVADMYFYARDENTLNLCQLMLTNIRRIDKLIVKSDLDKY